MSSSISSHSQSQTNGFDALQLLKLQQELFEEIVITLPRDVWENIGNSHLRCNSQSKPNLKGKITCLKSNVPARVWENRATVNILLKRWLEARHDLTHAIHEMGFHVPNQLWERRAQVNSQLGLDQEAKDDHYSLKQNEVCHLLELPQELFEKIVFRVHPVTMVKFEQTQKELFQRTDRYWMSLVTRSQSGDIQLQKGIEHTAREKFLSLLALTHYLAKPDPAKFEAWAQKFPSFGAYMNGSKFADEEKRVRESPNLNSDFLIQGLFFLRDYSVQQNPEIKEKISNSISTAICKNIQQASEILTTAVFASKLNSLVDDIIFIANYKAELHKNSYGINYLRSKLSPKVLNQRWPTAYQTLISRAEENFENNFEIAADQLSKALQIGGPRDQVIFYKIIEKYYRLSRWSECVNFINQVFKALPSPTDDLLYVRASANYNLNRYKEVLEDCDILIKRSNNQVIINEMWRIKALAHLHLESLEEATNSYRIALKLDPKSEQSEQFVKDFSKIRLNILNARTTAFAIPFIRHAAQVCPSRTRQESGKASGF